jgi:hypothetical protein
MRVLRVTNLNASGPGLLRAALKAKGPRRIEFDVSRAAFERALREETET